MNESLGSKDTEALTMEIECPHCDGTGLFQHYSAKEGSAYSCYHCKGTGKAIITYKPFSGRRKKDGVTRIFEQVGRNHWGSDHTFENGLTIRFSEGGCSYEEWLDGVQPKPVEDYYCPAEYDCEFRCERCPIEIQDRKDVPDNCQYKGTKAECWREYHSTH